MNYDINEFYVSITEKTVDETLNLARKYILNRKDKITDITDCR